MEVALRADVATGGPNGLPLDRYPYLEGNHFGSAFDARPTSTGATSIIPFGLYLALYVDVVAAGNVPLALALVSFDLSVPTQVVRPGERGAAMATIMAAVANATVSTNTMRLV